jgi:hypothetical protein
MRTNAWSWLAGMVVAVPLTVLAASPVSAAGFECTPALLDGLYVFTATGFSIPTAPNPALPQAIVELIRFNGDGSVTVPGVSLSLNGTIVVLPPGGTGAYTVVDLVPRDDACIGNVTFSSPGSPSLNFVVSRTSETIWLISRNPNTVFQGSATKLSH